MEQIKSLPQDKQAMLSKWKISGKSIKQYCIDENKSYHSMSYWHRKAKKIAMGNDKRFIKLKIKEASLSDQNTTEVIFNNGNKIIFHFQVKIHQLKELLR